MDNDKRVQEAVLRELKWEPRVNAAHIGVRVKGGAVTLTGHVSSYSEKVAAVRAAERVYGVTAVADELEIRLPGSAVRDDTDLAEQIAQALRWSILVPDTVQVEVRDGDVTLRGDVRWNFQRRAAERAVRDMMGVRDVINLIKVKPRSKPKPTQVEKRIAEAIERNANLDARSIWVTTNNGTVRLHGHVHSLWEKRVAEEAAATAPGVAEVVNKIEVTP